MKLNDIETRIDLLVSQAETALRNARTTEHSQTPAIRTEEFAELRAAGLSFLESIFGPEHSYYKEFNRNVAMSWESNGRHALGILRAVQQQIKNGWIETTRGLVTAEVFADFLEMADHFLDQGYKDPAAVMAGSVLEEHLRQLCVAASIPIEDTYQGKPRQRKADALNSDLAKTKKYSVADQKQVTAWLDLRNKAAHGKYAEYVEQQVILLVAGVRDFISRNRP
jgi:hypothetical protein